MAGPAPLLDICPLGVFLRPFGKLDMMAELDVSWFVFPCAPRVYAKSSGESLRSRCHQRAVASESSRQRRRLRLSRVLASYYQTT